MMQYDQKYSFIVNEGSDRRTFYFRTNQEKPFKLGDGTFGVVYQVYSSEGEPCAVKLLYNNQTFSQMARSRLTEEVIIEFCSNFHIDPDDAKIKALRELKRPSENSVFFTVKAQSIGLDDQQYGFLVSRILKDSRSIAVERFNYEMNSSKNIREKLDHLGHSDEFAGVISIIGGTQNFCTSSAYQNLREHFEDLQMQISDYALVMPLYRETLKDLLEKGTRKYSLQQSAISKAYPISNALSRQLSELSNEAEVLKGNIDKLELPENDKKTLKDSIYELVGYDIIEAMPFSKRISTILPYLIDIAQGLKALHMSGLFHHDLKPANVFVKKSGQEVQSVIGDLGFLSTKNLISTVQTNFNDILPLGTRHYRSPEQKDYFDICDAEVNHRSIGIPERKTVVLTISDPKFQDSIIEKGDFLTFSKDADRTRYIINTIDKNNDATLITLVGEEEKLTEKIKEDKITQVIMYKQQAIRTDLFGIGAIAFDMLTCGQSPERFYDNIRGYDTHNDDITTIMELYRQVSSYTSNEPGLIHVFAPFKHQKSNTYAPAEIVELILKFMLYKAKNTFYSTIPALNMGHSDDHKAVDSLLKHMTGLRYPIDKLDNALLDRVILPTSGQDFNILSEKINELQSLEIDNLALRFAKGIWYFRELVKLIRKTLDEKVVFLAEVLPENIFITPDGLSFIYVAYKKDEEYKDDLCHDTVYTKITRDITNPYVPNQFTFLRRRIRLDPIIHENNTFRYTFSGSSMLGNWVEDGDWVVVNTKLGKIKTLENDKISIEIDNEKSTGKLEIELKDKSNKSNEYLYYKRIDPCKYYLSMLGIYIYQIFFVGTGNISRDKPLIVNIAQIMHCLHHGTQRRQIKTVKIKEHDSKNKLTPIFQLIAQIYTKSTFPENVNSYYDSHMNDENRILALMSDADSLQKMIESFIEEMPAKLDKLITNFEDEKNERLKRKILSSELESLDFNSLIQQFVDIPIDKKKGLLGWSI